MGQAKLKKTSAPVVYHHTSTLRTNLIWMSGVIELEGKGDVPIHPQIGPIHTDVLLRRPLKDFPSLAWFTLKKEVPRCLCSTDIIDKDGRHIKMPEQFANAISLHRVAIGFPLDLEGLIPWKMHYGYKTAEGMELNSTAIDVGDNPEDWYVSEAPVDILHATEILMARSIHDTKLIRLPEQIAVVHRMVRICREKEGVYIPPSWIPPEKLHLMLKHSGIPLSVGGRDPS